MPQPFPFDAEVRLAGPHAALEPLRQDHARELWPSAAEHDIWRYMIHDVRAPADLESWVQGRITAREAGTAIPFLIRDAQGAAVGSTSIFDVTAHHTMEVGHTWLGAAARRTPVNTQAKLLVLGHCFETLGAIRVQLKTDKRNARSRTAIARIGGHFEGILRHQMTLPDGTRRNSAIFSIVDTEWPAVKARLQARLATPASA